MATLTTGVVLLRWQLLSAVMMFLASTLNIRFRRSDYVGLAVISSGLGVVSACWFSQWGCLASQWRTSPLSGTTSSR